MLDRRLNAFRPDLADAALKGRVEAERFVSGTSACVSVAVCDMRSAPGDEAGLATQLVFGEEARVFDVKNSWAWVQAVGDGYVGYVNEAELAPAWNSPTHIVSVPRTFLYPEADLKLPRTGYLSMGSLLGIERFEEWRGTRYGLLASGEAVIAGHLRPVGELAEDYVSVAETLLHAPYLWGGATAFGIDCSGLVQLAMRMTGRKVLRDSDMQAATIGEAIEPGDEFAGLQRGDLVFWKGHVGIMSDEHMLLHANGHTMMVSREPLRHAVERIGYLYGGPTGFRRP